MERTISKNGYLIQLYQYAQRYRYNNEGCLSFFNYSIDNKEPLDAGKHVLNSHYLSFGDFDLLQIVCVDSFRKYHDVSELAKDWLGKRQSVLLYDIASPEVPTTIYYDEDKRIWKNKNHSEIQKKFFCLSMLSLTNEIIEKTEDISGLLCTLRHKILSIVGDLNRSGICKLECEVFGTFNTPELAIVWLSDQYVEILQLVDYIKCMKVISSPVSDKGKDDICSVFFNSFSCIAIKESTNPENVLGNALIQIAVHDVMKDCRQLKEFAYGIVGDESKRIFYSVGEYDLVIEVSAQRAMELIQRRGMLSVGKREVKTGKFKMEIRPFLRNNTRLLLDGDSVQDLKGLLEEWDKKHVFTVNWPQKFKQFFHQFEWQELIASAGDNSAKSNADYFQTVRKKLKKLVSPSAGAVDTLDLMYADYHSVISTAYSAMWVSDLHRQFKGVLYAIDLLISSNDLEWSWDNYLDLTNAFKQQIYHLTQSSRMFFETPSCHFRATGQYDFLMHTYYGITKKILEVIYLIQGADTQSELVPLITVNTVPQVKTQLYFELGSDDTRVINLDIPNSIIFDPKRGIWYLAHELFHYAVPLKRKDRNYRMALFLLSYIFQKQFFSTLRELLCRKANGLIDEKKTVEMVGQILGDQDEENRIESLIIPLGKVNEQLLAYVIRCFPSGIQPFLDRDSKSDGLSSNYQRAIYKFAEGHESEGLFQELFIALFFPLCKNILGLDEREVQDEDAWERVKERIEYCQRNEEYVKQFIKSNAAHRVFDKNLIRYTWIAMDEWSAVREACSDIAMVSLNGLSSEDYMLFCIQAWTDASKDKAEVLEQMKTAGEQHQRIRYAFVAEYFLTQSRKGWDDYADVNYRISGDAVKKEFCKRYVWFYASKAMKQPKKGNQNKVLTQFEHLYQRAEQWLNFFTESRKLYQEHYSLYYNNILGEIFSDFDIDKRIGQLRKNGMNHYAQRVENIQTEFKENVYAPYDNLFQVIPNDFTNHFWGLDIEKIKECNQDYKHRRFKQDISVAHHFQKQNSLCTLGELNLEIQRQAQYYPDTQQIKAAVGERLQVEHTYAPCWQFHVYSLTELLFYLRYCFEELNKLGVEGVYCMGQRKHPSIWFRGQTSVKYKHVPTVMRNYKGEIRAKYHSLRSYQQSNFEEFKFWADGAPEMPRGMRFTQSDYIAMMQHYSAPTNFLDWTEHAFTSLYFALKYYYGKNLKEGDSGYRNVTLSLFHPGVYNHVRLNSLEAIRKVAGEIGWVNEYFKKVLKPENTFANLIPNLSTRTNEEYFDMFLLGDVRADKALAKMDEKSRHAYGQACNTELRDLFMPMAVLTSRLNSRIRTQFGCFVAYNLYAPLNLAGKTTEDKLDSFFDYISLEEIQERKKEEAIFMYQITIDRECCKEVVEWLEALGVSRENIFPELSEKPF